MEAIDWLPYGTRSYYPHMGTEDAATWERFISKYPSAYEQVAYDVAVGEGASFNTIVNPATGGHVNKLYQRRIDVVAKDGGSVHLIEVKPFVTTSALGQIQSYEKLFMRDFPQLDISNLIIVTGHVAPDMEFLLEGSGVELVVV